MQRNFEITRCQPVHFVGMEIYRSDKNQSTFIHGTSYIRRILTRFNVGDAAPNSVPADPHEILTLDQGEPLSNNVPYREALGSFMYTTITTRPDITFRSDCL